MYDAVCAWGGLDQNSAYAYLLACDRFAMQSALAERGDELLGFVVGLSFPETQDALFVWQVGVSPAARGQHLASRLIDAILECGSGRYRVVEAHVGPHNQASMRLFQGLARRHHTDFQVRDDYPADWFPKGHDAERLVRIGPLGPVPASPTHQE
ncbi:MAG: diaminobutyrate acetyltransferase [Sandaracinaceae bacterium]|nr:diaminobutyrate acetyltransferase [Myxococcales bacterium]MCB9656846.1 diaminobutyrate acetyltransferase [Sandaracinaceae bacterium]